MDRVLDLSWLSVEVADLYSDGMGRPGIDPGKVYKALSDRDIQAVIPPRPDTRPSTAKGFPTRRLPL